MKRIILIAVLVTGMAGAAQADIFGVAIGTGAPPATLGGYTMTAFGDDVRPVFSDVSSVDSPLGGTVDFSAALNHLEIGSGWATWSHGYTGDVYYSTGTSVTLTLPALTAAFDFYAEPAPFSVWRITATAQDGTQVFQDVDGQSGAAGFGFYTTAGSLLSTITVSTATGFAVGEFGIATVPVPGAVLLGLLGLGAAGCRLRKRTA